MRRSFLLIYALGVGTAACSGNTARNADTAAASVPIGHDTAVVQRIIDSSYTRLSAAFVAGNADSAAAMYADDAIVLPPNTRAVRGRNAVDKMTAAMLRATKITAITFKTTDLVLSGDYAIETGTFDLTSQPTKGSPVRDVGKYITVWKRQADGSWKIFRDIGNSDQPTS
jgi:uncharacterized protein (TIGR02246 family)